MINKIRRANKLPRFIYLRYVKRITVL
jgi:hypothetical protein